MRGALDDAVRGAGEWLDVPRSALMFTDLGDGGFALGKLKNSEGTIVGVWEYRMEAFDGSDVWMPVHLERGFHNDITLADFLKRREAEHKGEERQADAMRERDSVAEWLRDRAGYVTAEAVERWRNAVGFGDKKMRSYLRALGWKPEKPGFQKRPHWRVGVHPEPSTLGNTRQLHTRQFSLKTPCCC